MLSCFLACFFIYVLRFASFVTCFDASTLLCCGETLSLVLRIQSTRIMARLLSTSTSTSTSLASSRLHAFPVGPFPRICPGKELADNSIWLSIAMALALFDIRKPVDPATGKEVEPVVEALTGIISCVSFSLFYCLSLIVVF